MIPGAGMDPYEDTRPCECCRAPGVLPLGRDCLCLECESAECDPLEQFCLRVDEAGEPSVSVAELARYAPRSFVVDPCACAESEGFAGCSLCGGDSW